VDSRVILDQPGAERLLGRGDMLYMSGDAPSAVRLQGVYVSDNEINTLTSFWRQQMTPEDVVSKPLGSFSSGDDAPASSSWGNLGRNVQRPATEQVAFWDRELGDEANNIDDDDDEGADGEDTLYDEAVEMVRRLNKASVSLLQRRLRIGYTRAARLIDMMEERGVVGPPTEGSKPREVLPEKD
jgi:S-DNA-T family DNA segregation ATPase FtsK/SpoIIIE